MNRFLQVLLIVSLSLVLLAGCKDKKDKNVEPTLAPAATLVVPTKAPASTLAPIPTLAPTPTSDLSTFDSPVSPLPTPQ